MRFLEFLLNLVVRRRRRVTTDPYAMLLADSGLTHGEREALLALRRD